jgi:hypothetical protein
MSHLQQPTPRILAIAIENARARFDIPITHLVSSYGLVQEGVQA